MFESDTFTKDMLSNPTKLAKAMIDAMESSDTNGGITFKDPNNGFVMMMAANLALYSKFSEKVDHVNSFFYPQRARSAEQLYSHLSEFDYVKLMASPATLPFTFAMSKQWIIENGVYYDTNYNKLEIPATSFITMGGVTYSMYHPIEILINRNTGAVTALYDTSSPNALNVLASNMLKDVQEYTKDGIQIFQISFNMYQFERKTETFSIGSEAGFIRSLKYDDQFYAVKVFTETSKGVWKQLAYSLTQLYYDYETPTAILSVLTDSRELKIEIPQIYFDNKQISQTIKVEMYTTKGAVNYTLSAADVTGVKANFDPSSSSYAIAMDKMPFWVIVPSTLEVSGGSNGMTYPEIREAIVNQRLYDRVAVTTPEIIEAGRKAGFDLVRITDDLTERIYYAYNILADSNGMIVPTFAGNILIAGDSLSGNPSSILDYSDGYYTILPTTTFTVSNSGLVCTPMTDGQVSAMAQMSNAQLVEELNKGIYVRQPFHITLVTTPKSPQALIYNLLAPSMTSLVFVAENTHSAPQMSVTACRVNHLNDGTGGYQILLSMTRSSNLVGVDPSNLKVTLICDTKSADYAYLPATYVSTDSDDVDTWLVQLSTSYHITSDDYMSVSMYDEDDTLSTVEISLHQTFTVATSFIRSYDVSIPIDKDLNTLLSLSQRTNNVVMAKQSMKLSFGHNLSSQIYCGVNTSWGSDVYETAADTVYYQTNIPIFQLNETGALNTRINSTTENVEIVEIYAAGSTPSSTADMEIKTSTNTAVPAVGATSTALTIDDVTGILVSMPVRGTNIPANALVSNITGNVITINKRIASAVPADTVLTFTNSSIAVRTTAAQSSPGDILTVSSTAGMIAGQSVQGFDIPANAKILDVQSPTQIKLSVPTTTIVSSGTLLTVINKTAHGVVKIQKGEVITTPDGDPVVLVPAKNQFLIPSILFDGRLFSSDDPNDQQIVTTISQYIQNYANQISTIDAGLIEDSNVYYKPTRTMGFAKFGVGGGKTITMSLELSFSFTVYVDVSVYNTQTLLSTMTNSIINIVNSAIQKSIISVSEITDLIRENLGNNVVAVEGGDISGIDGLRLVSLEDSGASPSIENLLSIENDGSIHRSPNISITYSPKPDTSKVSMFAV